MAVTARRGPTGALLAATVALLALTFLVALGDRSAPAATNPCAVSYRVDQWPEGFTASVGVTNNGAPLTAWTLTWTFAGAQHVTSAWNAQVSQTGQAVTATNLPYNGTLGTGGTVSFGFQATYSGSNDVPANFALNGVACDGGTPPTTTTPPPTTSTPGGGGTACAATAFCDGFENQASSAPSGRWSVTTPNCSGTGTATVDSTQAHSGGKSIRINGGGGYCNHVFIADTQDMATASPAWNIRMWVRHTSPLPTGHVTFLAMNDSAHGNTDLRFGGQTGALMWNRQTDDQTLPDQSPAGVAQSLPLPVNTWTCVEFAVNAGNGQIHTWVNGTAVPGLTEDGVPTANIDDQWLGGTGANWRPRLTDLKLGWESYGGGTDTLWFDDVALGTSRIGC